MNGRSGDGSEGSGRMRSLSPASGSFSGIRMDGGSASRTITSSGSPAWCSLSASYLKELMQRISSYDCTSQFSSLCITGLSSVSRLPSSCAPVEEG